MPDTDPDHPVANLADRSFWEEEYFGGTKLPSRPDLTMPFERCLARALEAYAPVTAGQRVLEVGCAPAKWLVFYAERFGAAVEGLEYSQLGVDISRENLRRTGLTGTIHHGDFFALAPSLFDLVLSLGFIEHFDDLDRAFERHLEFLAPGGCLVVGVPNYRGVNRALQHVSDPAHLRRHNLEAMEPARYVRWADRYGLELEHIGHLGGLDPVIIKLGRRIVTPLVMVGNAYRRLGVADRVNHPWFSSYLLAVMRRS